MTEYSSPLPVSWVEVPIETLLVKLSDGKKLHQGWSPQCEKEASTDSNVWGVLKTTAIQNGIFHPEHNKRLPDKLSPRVNLEVQKGDILLTCAGPRSRCGIPCYVRATRPKLILSGKMYRFRALPEIIEPRYLEAFLQSTQVQSKINAMKTGISDSGLNLTHNRFRELPVRVPPYHEQIRIADRLDELFTDLSAGVVALERVKRKLARYRAAVLHAAVTGRLTEDWRKKHGPAEEPGSKLLERILVERRRQWEQRTLQQYEQKESIPPKSWRVRYSEPQSPNFDTSEVKLQELPSGWCWATHDQIGYVQLGRQRSPQHHSGEHMRPYLRVANVYEDRIDLSDILEMNFTPVEYEAYHLKPNDILLNEGQSLELIGRPAIYRGELPGGCFQNTLVRQRVYDGVLPEYAFIVCRAQYHSGRFRQIASITTSIAHLGAQRFAALEFPLPPEQEQAVIIDRVQERLSQIDALENEVKLSQGKSRRLRQAILKAAFDGRLLPQRTDDEPASDLLERIKYKTMQSTSKSPRNSNKKQRKVCLS